MDAFPDIVPGSIILALIKMPCKALLHATQQIHNPMLCRQPLRQHIASDRSPISSAWPRQTRKKHFSTTAACTVCYSSNTPKAFDTGRGKIRLPTQGESVVQGSGGPDTMLQELPKPPADIDYLAVRANSCSMHSGLCLSVLYASNHVPLCRSLLQCSRVAPKTLASLGPETWASCIRIS